MLSARTHRATGLSLFVLIATLVRKVHLGFGMGLVPQILSMHLQRKR